MTATTYAPSIPLADTAYITQTPPKPTSWGGSGEATAIYAPSLPDQYVSPQTYAAAPHQELYHQHLHPAHHQHGF